MSDSAAKICDRMGGRLPRCMFAWILMLASVGACDDATDLPPATPLEVVIESGDEQIAEAGDTLPEPVVATVLRPDGEVSLRSIWVELRGGGALDLGGIRGSGDHVVLRSKTLGTISVEWALSENVGTQRLRFFTLELYGDTVEAFATAEATPSS